LKLEIQRYGRNKETQIDSAYIESAEFRRKFDNLTDNDDVNRLVYNKSKEILYHRSGTEYEDLAFIDTKTGVVLENSNFPENEKLLGKEEKDVIRKVKPTSAMRKMVQENPYSVIAVHNHPGSSLPSLTDLNTALLKKYKFGIILAHSGKIYKYTVFDNFNEIVNKFNLIDLEDAITFKNLPLIKELMVKMSEAGLILEVF
jgi:proteasome lid subunit RPN8/RPN11